MPKEKFDMFSLTEYQIREMATTMDSETLPSEVVEYLKMMEQARDWFYQMKSRKYCIQQTQTQYFLRTGNKLSDYYAQQIFENAINYFYADRKIRKESWRNIIAEKYLLAAQLCFDQNDLAGYRKFLNDVERLKRLNEKDDEGVDPKLLDRRVMVYVLSGKELGVPEVDRNELARMIDSYEINETMKIRIKRDAGSLPRKLFDLEIEDIEEEK